MATTQVSGVITASATPNVKGSYTQLTASAPAQLVGLFIHISGINDSGAARFALDIATGAAASEVVLISNIIFSNCTINVEPICPSFYVPVNIASSTRIAARLASSVGSSSIGLQVTLVPGTASGAATFETYGVSGTNGTQIDPGATPDTKGSWTQLVASTTIRGKYYVVLISQGDNVSMTTATWELDIGIGGNGSEVVLIPGIVTQINGGIDSVMLLAYCFYVDVPIGTRISARAACTIGTAIVRILEVAVISCNHVPFN